MPQFRRRPTIITAEQYRNEPFGWPSGVCTCDAFSVGGHGPHVHTMHGNQIVELENGDWIVPEPDGVHFYPVADEVMRSTYELIEETDDASK